MLPARGLELKLQKSQKLIMFRLKSYAVKMENRKKLNLSKVAITFHTFPLAVLAH